MSPLSLLTLFLRRRPLLLYATAWTALLTAAVAVSSLSPEIAFVWATSPSSTAGRACRAGYVRVLMDGPAAAVCLPVRLFARSAADIIVPPLFAALVVAGSAFLVRAIGVWGEEDEEQEDRDS